MEMFYLGFIFNRRRTRQQNIDQYDTVHMARRPMFFRAATVNCPAYLSTMGQTPAPPSHAYPSQADECIPMRYMSNPIEQSTEEDDDHLYESPVF